MTAGLISIIIPVYNVKDYLAKCVNSVIGQSYRNLEIILVDDGSSDGSEGICDEFARKDERVKVIHKSNGGLSSARNVGIEHSSGEFLVFCDSDDWLEADILRIAIDKYQMHQGCVIIWGFSIDVHDCNDGLVKSNIIAGDFVCNKNDGYKALLNFPCCKMYGYAWNKLYPRYLLNVNVRFPHGISLVEDTLFNAEVLSKSRELVFINSVGTHYVQRRRITLGTAFYPNYFQLIQMAAAANTKLYRTYGAAEKDIERFLNSYLFAGIQSFVRMLISLPRLGSMQKRRDMVLTFLSEQGVSRTLESILPTSFINKIYWRLLVSRHITFLQIIETVRNWRKTQ